MTDKELILAIHALLDKQVWSPDTLQNIAGLLTGAGYDVRDLQGEVPPIDPPIDKYEALSQEAKDEIEAASKRPQIEDGELMNALAKYGLSLDDYLDHFAP